jgi:hypothetical protein
MQRLHFSALTISHAVRVTDDAVVLNDLRVADIHLLQGHFGVGTVAHELMHFVRFWCDVHSEDDEENQCQLVGLLNKNFWDGYYAMCDPTASCNAPDLEREEDE